MSITDEDIRTIPEIKSMIKKEDKYIQDMYNYASDNYDNEIFALREECPYNTDISEDLYIKQVFSWVIPEKIISSLRRTILSEFIEKYVAREDPDVAERLSKMGDVIRGPFQIIDSSHFPLIAVKHLESSREFIVISRVQVLHKNTTQYRKGEIIDGRIYPWWGKYYMFNGVLTIRENDYELFKHTGIITNPNILLESYERAQISKYESIYIQPGTKLLSAMNKFPSYWVDAMCSAIGIDTGIVSVKRDKIREIRDKLATGYALKLLRENFKDDQISAIKKIRDNGWIIKYGLLSKQFSTDISLFWNEHKPESDIGILRLYGFVIVGKLLMGSRYYKVALIPIEIRSQVEEFFSSIDNK